MVAKEKTKKRLDVKKRERGEIHEKKKKGGNKEMDEAIFGTSFPRKTLNRREEKIRGLALDPWRLCIELLVSGAL